jgi:hypothetical protein
MSRSFELLQLASVQTIKQPVRMTLSVRPKLQDFFPKHRYGMIAATVRFMWIPVLTHSSIRQVSQFKSRCPDASHHGPEARVSNIEIACIKSTVWMTILLVRTREAFIWKLLAANVQPSRHGFQTGTIYNEIFEISVAQLSVRKAYDHLPDGTQFYQARRSFELSAYK